MNDNFKCIYKILKTLETAMDYTDYDFSAISHEALEISKERWTGYLEMMNDSGLIKGLIIKEYAGGDKLVHISGMKITLKGLEFLSENTIMQRMYKAAKGIKDVIG